MTFRFVIAMSRSTAFLRERSSRAFPSATIFAMRGESTVMSAVGTESAKTDQSGRRVSR